MKDPNKIIYKGTFDKDHKLSHPLFDITLIHWALTKGYPTKIAADSRKPWLSPEE